LSTSIVPWPALAGALVAAVVGALYAGADIAITSLSPPRLEALHDQASGPEKRAYERIQRENAKLRSRYLLGRVAATAVTAVCMVEVFAPMASGAAAAALALLCTVVLTAVLFEVTTTLARRYVDQSAAWVARWLRPLEILMVPLADPLGAWGTRLVGRRAEQPADPKIGEAEVEAMVDQGERAGIFGRDGAEMLRNVLDFADRTAKDVMIPRNKVEGIDITTSIEDVLRLVAESGHSRYPVYREQIDNIVGLLYAKDLFKAVHFGDAEGGSTAQRVDDLVRTTANFVAESQPLSSLLKEMRQKRQHLAIVVDEFGSVSGIVTLEDVLEEIVGDIRDEHDTEETAAIEDLGDGRVVADAAVSLKDLFTHLGAEIDDESEHDSLGGMLTQQLGRIPEVGTALDKFGLRFVVRASDERKIGKVEVTRV
jgi:CBS domain containing-hemolysin-like protein